MNKKSGSFSKQLLGAINIKNLMITVISVFAFIFVSDFIIHGVILRNVYMETASLWRPESEMQSFMIFMLLGQFLIAKFFCVLFARGYENKGIMEGVRFALLLTPLTIGQFLIQFSVTPLPGSLLAAWIFFACVQTLSAGVIAALIYKK